MELLIAGMYGLGILVMLWVMAHIRAFVDRICPLEDEKASRTRGHAQRLAEEVNQQYISTEREARQVDRKIVGVIKSGELVKIQGDEATVRELAASQMGQEIVRLNEKCRKLEGENAMLRARAGVYWGEKSERNHRRKGKRLEMPEWLRSLHDRLVIRWAVLTLGREAVYGQTRDTWPEMCRVKGGWIERKKAIVYGGAKHGI